MNYQKRNKGKKWIWILAAVLVMVLTVFIVMQITGDDQSYRTVSVVEVSGRVGVVKDGMEYSAYPGMMLQEGHEIVTADDSFVRLVLDGDKYVKLEAGSKLVFETLGMQGSGRTRLCLERGALTTELVSPLKSDEEYVVNTPNAVLAVRGTFFRVSIDMGQNGVVISDVFTYGGGVASRRIMPDGEIVEEEVLVKAGYKTGIKKNEKETVYIVSDIHENPGATGAQAINTEPILWQDISDDDLVDIYFSAENGHELFETSQRVGEEIAARKIHLENKVSVYEKAEEVLSPQVTDGVVADDSLPLVRTEENVAEKDDVGYLDNRGQETGPMTDGDGMVSREPEQVQNHEHSFDVELTLVPTCTEKGEQTYACECGYNYAVDVDAAGHTEVEGGIRNAHRVCDTCGEILEETHVFTQTITQTATCTEAGERLWSCECGYHYTTGIAMTDHVVVSGGTEDCHGKCELCGQVVSVSHECEERVVAQPTCKEKGRKECVCVCGYTYTMEIATTSHSEVFAGTDTVHSKCSSCGQTLSSTHNIVEKMIVEADCETVGKVRYSCQCGYGYEEERPALGHTELSGGTADAHTKCNVCGKILAGENAHVIEESTIAPTCTVEGKAIYACRCGYSYEVSIPALGHEEIAGATADIHKKCNVCGDVLEDGSSHDYTDTTSAATCTTDGVTTHECDCGYTYETVIPATGHSEVGGGTADVHTLCDSCDQVLADGSAHSYTENRREGNCLYNGLLIQTCTCGYEIRTELPMGDHTPSNGAQEMVHSMCGLCGLTLADGSAHSYTDTRTEPTCISQGMLTRTCSCGYVVESAIPKTEHIAADGCQEDIHSVCSYCNEVLADGSAHQYTSRTTEAKCLEAGKIVYTCSCGYEYETGIPPTGHTEVDGGLENVHKKCSSCGEVLLDGNYHSTGSITTDATCTTAGKTTYSCDCGYTYEVEIPAKGHMKANESDYTYCLYCGGDWVAINEFTFSDEAFRTFVAVYDTNNDGELLAEELTSVTSMSVAGSAAQDGGYTDLTGIMYFTELTSLDCSYNAGLTWLNLTNALKLTTIDVSQCTSLTSISTGGRYADGTLTIIGLSDPSIVID